MKKSMWLTLLIPTLLFLFIGCSNKPVDSGKAFLTALQQHNFEEAATLSTNETAAIVLFMKQMLIATEETGEYLEFPLPTADTKVEHLTTTAADGYLILEYASGNQNFVLHSIETDGKWKIRLPRSSW